MPTVIDVATLRLPRAIIKLHTGREAGIRPIDCGSARLLEDGSHMDIMFQVVGRLIDELTREEFDALPPEAVEQILAAAGKPQVEAAERAVGES